MKNEILAHLDNPGALERLYRKDRSNFRRAFESLSAQLAGHPLTPFWNARLQFGSEVNSTGGRKDLLWVIFASLVAGLVAKLPAIFNISEEVFYPRNIGFIVFPVLTAWFAWKNHLSKSGVASIVLATLAGIIFLEFFPGTTETDTLILSCVHMLVYLWTILGFAFTGTTRNNVEARMSYLRFNGDLVVMTTLILIAAGILSAVTIGLFTLIGLDIRIFYVENVVFFGLPAAPILATYLIQQNPQLVGRISPVIARLFSPLVLAMLLIYLVAIIYSGKDPYNDREFLLVFNVLLVGVMALIVFSVAENKSTKSRIDIWVLALLSLLTVIVNGIALSAILFRISEWGMTPNRAAVLGGNVLILVNLLLVTVQLFRVLSGKKDLEVVRNAIAFYLPVYGVWAAVVTFVFPYLFGFQ